MNRFLTIPPETIHTGEREIRGGDMIRRGFIRTPSGDLPFTHQWKWHNNNSWLVEHPVNSIEDLRAVAAIPWKLDRELIRRNAADSFPAAQATVGDRGVLRFGVSSPIVVISGLMSLQLFLELSYTHRAYMHELLEEITRRTLDVLKVVFEDDAYLDTTANFGGSEQVTPPMMAPELFDELVVPYDGPLVDYLKTRGILVNVHCHGKVRYALRCMREMGVDSTDPVEPPPAGDVTFAEAQEIVDGRVTLIGNLEFDELTHLDPPAIRARVKEIFRNGNRRIILGASAGPNTHISEGVAENYRAFVDAGLAYGS
jgi:uroporphyrinogen-III decarboxylase